MATTVCKFECDFQFAGEWRDKVWGRTRCVINRPHYQLHELRVIEGFCSIHYHEHRANRFIVESGSIEVVQHFWQIPKSRVLCAGEHLDVPSLVVHQFRVIEAGVVFEEYWPDRGDVIRSDDIIRLELGGVHEPGDFLSEVNLDG